MLGFYVVRRREANYACFNLTKVLKTLYKLVHDILMIIKIRIILYTRKLET